MQWVTVAFLGEVKVNANANANSRCNQSISSGGAGSNFRRAGMDVGLRSDYPSIVLMMAKCDYPSLLVSLLAPWITKMTWWACREPTLRLDVLIYE